ncbi:hypothetical protein IWX90DRAFT_415979 [Phyllosticta citrichinensis]|uniref:Uncharacterized protein n=1 Tax=Phyllosticta citrichinensis TaxID=1130410 RepID=A0ABR1XR58_9PEZI
MYNGTSANDLTGWVPESSGRGTMDIITSCFFTILICTWTVIHPRVLTTQRIARLHKLAQLVKTILAPEMICLESLQEWVQARKMVKRSSHATQDGLKIVQAFYVGMLGIRYRTPHGSRALWPSQYTWLLNNDLVKWSDRDAWGLSEDVIQDKSKADGLVKLTAVIQVTWFLLQCITRAAHDLAISPLEAMTLAYVFVVLITYLFWWLKPKDITTVSFVTLPSMDRTQQEIFDALAMENTYDDDDRNPKPSKNIAWYLVSRDCKDEDWIALNQPPSDADAEAAEERIETAAEEMEAESKRIDIATEEKEAEKEQVETPTEKGEAEDVGNTNEEILPKSRATTVGQMIQRSKTDATVIITQWDKDLYLSRLWPLICILGAAFGGIHLISWNSIFPTLLERWLWRASALISVATSIICMQFEAMSMKWDGPMTIIRVSSPILYVVSRFAMMGEVFAALRAMPKSTYDTFELWNSWFHIA